MVPSINLSKLSGEFFIGFDIGSVSLNTIVIDKENNIVENYYDYIFGKPFDVLLKRYSDILLRYSLTNIGGIAFTGSGGKLASSLTDGVFVNEIIAQATSTGTLYPDVKTIIEIGGEDSKLIILQKDPATGKSRLVDFEMNSICAAGTGSFLDQQAKRIGVPIENEFGAMALKSVDPPRIAGRCSVFAKSDMIHHQQIATPLHDIVAGLCFALARNFCSNVAKSRELKKPILFSGGVAANAGITRAFREILSLDKDDLIISDYHASMGAIGAVFYARNNNLFIYNITGTGKLEKYLSGNTGRFISLPQLKQSEAIYNKEVKVFKNGNTKTACLPGARHWFTQYKHSN